VVGGGVDTDEVEAEEELLVLALLFELLLVLVSPSFSSADAVRSSMASKMAFHCDLERLV
jgi:hypothetical protein